MMLKEVFSLSMVALLLAVIAFAALETWVEIRARQGHYETFGLEDPAGASHVRRGAEASQNH
jgi:hypothetical protein